MNCNVELHNAIKESGDILCPFCNKKLQDYSVEKMTYAVLNKVLLIIKVYMFVKVVVQLMVMMWLMSI